MRENEPVLLVFAVCEGEIILEKGEILSEKRQVLDGSNLEGKIRSVGLIPSNLQVIYW